MKYLVVNQPGTGECIYLFPNIVRHDIMATLICGTSWATTGKVVAAGAIFFEEGTDEPTTMYCTGESTTLRIKSRGDVDTALLKATLYAMG